MKYNKYKHKTYLIYICTNKNRPYWVLFKKRGLLFHVNGGLTAWTINSYFK